jgi:hypothetical protein
LVLTLLRSPYQYMFFGVFSTNKTRGRRKLSRN